MAAKDIAVQGTLSATARLLKICRAQLDYRISKGGIGRKFA